jgi:class 3 adenylate cyclase
MEKKITATKVESPGSRKAGKLQERKTQPTLRFALLDAQGISEFVIVVFVDVRGFSKFSKTNESPDIAMFIKRFYLELIDNYFDKANFIKPTGDGLLMTFPYNDKTLHNTATYVIQEIMRCLNEFPSMLEGDPMINFPVPENIGFGVARGTACCLHSSHTIIDYSGHLLNLAARLTELARPIGIVIDAGFQKEIIPPDYRERFGDAEVFIRSIAESVPIPVFILMDSVKLPKQALQPIEAKRWMTHRRIFKVPELRKLGQFFFINLPSKADKQEEIKVTFESPTMRGGQIIKDYISILDFKHYKVQYDYDITRVNVDLFAAADIVEKGKVPRTKKVTFKIDYVAEAYP